MASKKDKSEAPLVPVEFANQAQDELIKSLSTEAKYALTVDPTGIYDFTDKEKQLIEAYIQYRNVPYACKLAGISETEGSRLLMDPICRSEIRRINNALYYRKFSHRLLSIDEIGGYLTSLLIDDVTEAEHLESRDKLNVAKLIIELNKVKAEAFNDPAKTIDYIDIEKDVKELDVKAIKEMISKVRSPGKDDKKKVSDEAVKKAALIQELNGANCLDPTEIAYLQTCSIAELETLLANAEKKEK